MGSVIQGRKFDTLDLEMLDRVYALACLYIEAQNLCGTTARDKAKEQDELRKVIFGLVGCGRINFDTLSDKVLVSWQSRRGQGVKAA